MFISFVTYMQVDPQSYQTPRMTTMFKKSTRCTELGKLKMVKLEGFKNQEDEITLLKHIKELVTVEPLFIASSEESWGKFLTLSPTPKHAQLSV